MLAGVPREDLELIEASLERVELQQKYVLFEPGKPIAHVYFPETAVISLVSTLSDGATLEVGSIGCEGIAGVSVFLDSESSAFQAIVQIPGEALRIRADVFARLSEVPGPLHRRLLQYTLGFLTQVAQTAACNASHLVEERCARWLLITSDRVGGERFPVTHEFLAFMLGVGRPGVTVTMRSLQDAGLVRYTRGAVEIVDRDKLERTSCDCYRAMRTTLERLLPQTAGATLQCAAGT